jgi:hypothetical protein
LRAFGRTIFVIAALVLIVSASAWAIGSTSPGKEISANDFGKQKFDRSTAITNKWLPMKPGTQLVFEGTTIEGKDKIPHRLVFTVTDLAKVVGGVRSIVLWDRDWSDGQLVEAELAFFAQDNDGNVWQTGEYPEEYEDGKLVGNPTWVHGVKGTRAGLTMKAKPRLRTPSYSLGWAPSVGFNDRARVLKLGQKTCVRAGCYKNVLVVGEYNPDEPGQQLKYYAPGVGNVRVGYAGKDATKETLELTKVVQLSPAELAKARAAALRLEKHAYKISKKVYGTTPPAKRLR